MIIKTNIVVQTALGGLYFGPKKSKTDKKGKTGEIIGVI
jgi:hypothetical protein